MIEHETNEKLSSGRRRERFTVRAEQQRLHRLRLHHRRNEPAPIRIAEGDDNYGLTHIELRHGTQLRDNGFSCAHEFVEYVSTHFESIKQGIGDTFLLEVHNEHNDTLFIKLVKDLGYWKVISGGVFSLRYSKKKKEIYSGSDNRPPQPAPDGEGLSSL